MNGERERERSKKVMSLSLYLRVCGIRPTRELVDGFSLNLDTGIVCIEEQLDAIPLS